MNYIQFIVKTYKKGDENEANGRTKENETIYPGKMMLIFNFIFLCSRVARLARFTADFIPKGVLLSSSR